MKIFLLSFAFLLFVLRGPILDPSKWWHIPACVYGAFVFAFLIWILDSLHQQKVEAGRHHKAH